MLKHRGGNMNKKLVIRIVTTTKDLLRDISEAALRVSYGLEESPMQTCPECNDSNYDGKICAACQKYGPIKTEDF